MGADEANVSCWGLHRGGKRIMEQKKIEVKKATGKLKTETTPVSTCKC